MKPYRGVALAVATTLLMASCGGVTGSRSSSNRCPPTFDTRAWKVAAESTPDSGTKRDRDSIRVALAEQLRRCGYLRRADKGSVKALLGDPGPEERRTRSWDYYLGPAEWGIDSMLLFIEFDANNRVEFVEVGQG